MSAKLSRNKARSLKPSLIILRRISLCALRRVRNSYRSLSSLTLVHEVDSFEGRCVIQMKRVCSGTAESSVVGTFPDKLFKKFSKSRALSRKNQDTMCT